MSMVVIRGSNIFDSLSNPAIIKSNKGLKKAFISSHMFLMLFVKPSVKFAPLSAMISTINPIALKIFDSASSGYKRIDKALSNPVIIKSNKGWKKAFISLHMFLMLFAKPLNGLLNHVAKKSNKG